MIWAPFHLSAAAHRSAAVEPAVEPTVEPVLEPAASNCTVSFRNHQRAVSHIFCVPDMLNTFDCDLTLNRLSGHENTKLELEEMNFILECRPLTVSTNTRAVGKYSRGWLLGSNPRRTVGLATSANMQSAQVLHTTDEPFMFRIGRGRALRKALLTASSASYRMCLCELPFRF